MLIKFILLTFLSLNLLFATTLKGVYYITSDTITLQNIIKNEDPNIILFKIQKNKHNKKIKSKELIYILKQYGYENFSSRKTYINFIKKSPIDTSRIKKKIKSFYLKNYQQIDIRSILVEPRSYMQSLPETYTINIRSQNYLRKDATISIKTPSRKKIFFNYIIDANIDIYYSRKKIKKKTELSAINTTKKSIILDKFRAKPIQIIDTSTLQAKRHIPKNKILTIRDVERLNIIRKNTYISISLNSENMDISFSAKALQDGKMNEIIKVIKNNGKKLKVKVTGKNKAELR